MKLNLFAVFAVALVSVEAIQIERTNQFAEVNSDVEDVDLSPTTAAGRAGNYPKNSGITNKSIEQ